MRNQAMLAQRTLFTKRVPKDIDGPLPAIFYNESASDKIFYQGMALLRLNKKNDAQDRFTKLMTHIA